MYATEIQKHLIENQTRKGSISHVLTRDFGYSCKELTIVPKESLI